MRTTIETFRRIGRAVCGLTLVWMTGTAFAAGPAQHEIRLLKRSWTPAAGASQEMDHALAAQAQAARLHGQTRIHALVQLHDTPDESQRNDLSRGGIELGAYVPGNAWIATIPVERAAAAVRRPEVRWIEPWTAGHKLHPRLAEGEIAPWARDPGQPGWIAVMVLLHEDVDLGRGTALAERAGGSAGNPVEGLHGIPMWIPAAKLTALAAEEEVLWIEQAPPALSPANDGIRTQMKVNTVNSSPYDLDGGGVRLFVFDGGAVLASHESFNPGTGSRVTVIDSNSGEHAHSTHVAGTAAGDGSGSPGLRGRGVAPAVKILSAGADTSKPHYILDTADIEDDYATARNIYEADLANNSLGSNIAGNDYPCDWEGDYAATSSLIDKIVRGNGTAVNGPMITVWAAGNDRIGGYGRCGGNYQTAAEPACAKNPIHVGAINSDGASMTEFSGWGPCSDGRLKPTVVAPGGESGRVSGEDFIYSAACHADFTAAGSFCSSTTLYAGEGYHGTSMATPAVSGAISLLLQDWRQLSSLPPGSRLLPALVKAALMQTARDLGPEGPDYRYGYGAVDAQTLIDFERAAGTGSLGGPGLKVWGTGTLTHGSSDSFTITVPGGIAELKASLAWDDFAAAPFAVLALVNDLDLELVAPGGTVYHPFFVDPTNPHLPATATAANHLDNQEQVLVKNPQAGVWTVRVRGHNVPQGAQSYGLAYGATPQSFSTLCTPSLSHFELGNDSWAMSGTAVRVAAPAPGHGSYSARIGGINNDDSEMKRQFALPANQRSTWSFDLYMTTAEGAAGWGYDDFTAEVRNTSGSVLSVLSFHNDGDLPAVWLPERNIDLSPWAGQTVDLVFRVSTDGLLPTTFWVDDVRVTSCPSASFVQMLTFNSSSAQDGHVIESSENSNAGGGAVSNNSSLLGGPTFHVGDNGSDQQIKGFVSFDTSQLPDDAILVSARLILHRSSSLGTNPFTTHGVCRVEIRTGAFNNNVALEPADFQALATGQPVSILSNPTIGAYAYATLNAQGLAAIDKTGTTQLRISFEQGDNDDLASDALLFSAGEEASATLRPRLEVKYLVP